MKTVTQKYIEINIHDVNIGDVVYYSFINGRSLYPFTVDQIENRYIIGKGSIQDNGIDFFGLKPKDGILFISQDINESLCISMGKQAYTCYDKVIDAATCRKNSIIEFKRTTGVSSAINIGRLVDIDTVNFWIDNGDGIICFPNKHYIYRETTLMRQIVLYKRIVSIK